MKLVLATALLSLGACATTDIPEDPSYLWRCDAGVTFSARLTTGGNAQVIAGGKIYRLPGVMAASGARYSDGHVEFWEHGGEAMLNGAAGGPYENCKNATPT